MVGATKWQPTCFAPIRRGSRVWQSHSNDFNLFLSNQPGAISCLIFVLAISSSVLRFSLVQLMPLQLIVCSTTSTNDIYCLLLIFQEFEEGVWEVNRQS